MSTDVTNISRPTPSEPAGSGQIKQRVETQTTSESKEVTKPVNESNQTPDKSSVDHENVRQFNGIGPSIAQALNDGLGIYRYIDLADLTPGSRPDLQTAIIPSKFPQCIEYCNSVRPGQVPARNRQNGAARSRPGTDQTVSRRADRTTEQRQGETWHELADFFVSFGLAVSETGEKQLKIRAHHSQVDKSEQWSGIATGQLLDWMLRQANLPLQTAPESQVNTGPAIPRTVSARAATLELSDLWLSEVKPPPSAPRSRGPNKLRAGYRLTLSGPAAANLTRQEPCFNIELYLVDTQTHQPRLAVSSPGRILPGELTYNIQQDFPMPDVGSYQVHIVARLLPPAELSTHLQGPAIHVKP